MMYHFKSLRANDIRKRATGEKLRPQPQSDMPPAPEVFVRAFAPAALRRPAPPATVAQSRTLNWHSIGPLSEADRRKPGKRRFF